MRGDDPVPNALALAVTLVFPACAGMIPSLVIIMSSGQCVPRMRGDDPKDTASFQPTGMCSPHARG